MKALKSEGSIYKIEKVLGQGQSATVYCAVRMDSRGHSRQRVALKILRNENAVSWLRREFETLASVDSPHCVRVLTWDNLAEGCALALEWVDGLSLFELATAVDLPENLVVEVIAQIQDGLRALHQKKLHHGDLSPGNILIDQKGAVRLIDFATAALGEKEARGTPAYVAPEVWRGQSTGPQSDLFSVGLIADDLSRPSGFLTGPTTLDAARMRASAASQSSDSVLLNSDPALRDYDERYCQKPESASELGELVKSIMSERAKNLTKTRSIPVANDGNLSRGARRRIVLFVAGVVATSLLGFLSFKKEARVREERLHSFAQIAQIAQISKVRGPAQARRETREVSRRPVASGWISVGSNQWLRVFIDGKNMGYAPLEKSPLSVGTHRVVLDSKNQRRILQVRVSEGEHLRLGDDGPERRWMLGKY